MESQIHISCLPRTTERPVRNRGEECSDLPVRAALQSHGRKSVVRGLPNQLCYRDVANLIHFPLFIKREITAAPEFLLKIQ